MSNYPNLGNGNVVSMQQTDDQTLPKLNNKQNSYRQHLAHSSGDLQNNINFYEPYRHHPQGVPNDSNLIRSPQPPFSNIPGPYYAKPCYTPDTTLGDQMRALNIDESRRLTSTSSHNPTNLPPISLCAKSKPYPQSKSSTNLSPSSNQHNITECWDSYSQLNSAESSWPPKNVSFPVLNYTQFHAESTEYGNNYSNSTDPYYSNSNHEYYKLNKVYSCEELSRPTYSGNQNKMVSWNSASNISISLPPQPVRDVLQYFQNSHILLSPSSVILPTTTSIPSTKEAIKRVKIPLGVLTSVLKSHESIPYFAPSHIQRCKNCRTYLNPYVKWITSDLYICNVCGDECKFSVEAAMDSYTKQMVPLNELVLLRYSSYEMLATQVFNTKPPLAIHYLFIFDVSSEALLTKYLEVACRSLIESIDNIPGDGRTRFSIICYDSQIHFYSYDEKSTSDNPTHIIVTESEDPFLPDNDSLFLYLKRDREKIVKLLQILPEIHEKASADSSDSCLGSVITCAFNMMNAEGGKITIMYGKSPNTGIGPIISEKNEKTKFPFVPTSTFYKDFSLENMINQVSVSLFALCPEISEMTSINYVATYTGGDIYSYTWPIQLTNGQFEREFKNYLCRNIGIQAIVKIRHGPSIEIEKILCTSPVIQQKQITLPYVHDELCIGLVFTTVQSGRKQSENHEFIQITLFYTHPNGERRIRVHNIPFKMEPSADIIHANASEQAIGSLLAKLTFGFCLDSTLLAAKEALARSCSEIMSSCSKVDENCKSDYLMSTLNLPKSLHNLPAYFHGIIKLIDRKYNSKSCLFSILYNLLTGPVDMVLSMIYPRLVHVHDILNSSKPQDVLLQPCSAQFTVRASVMLLDAGSILILMFNPENSSDLHTKLVGSLPNPGTTMYNLPAMETVENERLRSFINDLRIGRPLKPSISILQTNSIMIKPFYELLIVDRFEGAESLSEFQNRLKKGLHSFN